MTKVIVAVSGKNGVDKMATSAVFFAGLTLRGYKTVVIDFDVGLCNLDLIMGCERRVVCDLINAVHGEASPNQTLIKDKECENPFILPTSRTHDKDALIREDVGKMIEGLKGVGFECIVCDSSAGIESDALMMMYLADGTIVVTSLEVSSVRGSDRTLGILSSKPRRVVEGRGLIKEYLLLTRYDPRRASEDEILSLADIQEALRIKLIDVIPESEAVLQASNRDLPAIHLEGSGVANAYHDVIDRFLGKEKELRYIECSKPGLLQRLFGGGK